MKSGRGLNVLLVLLGGLCIFSFGLTVLAFDESPGNVTGLANATGNFWINWTWDASLNADDYDIKIDNSNKGKDETTLFYNETCYPHALKTIGVRAHNHTYNNYSPWSSQTTQVPNNPVTILNIISNTQVEMGETINVDVNYLDADGDIPSFNCNRPDLFTDFDTTTGQGNWTTNETRTYNINFGASDGYSIDYATMIITVIDAITDTDKPGMPGITGLTNITDNFWISWNWANPPDLNFSHVMIYINGAWKTNTSNNFYNETYWPHATRTISTRTVDIYGNINSSWVNQTTNIPNNPVTLLNVPASISKERGQITYVDVNYLDADGDIPSFNCNRPDLFTDFDTTTGQGNWTTNETGTYNINFGASDGYSIDNTTLVAYVRDIQPRPLISEARESEGDSGALTGEPFENIADKEVQYIWTIAPGKETTVQLKNPAHSILEIKFVYSETADEVSATVEKLRSYSMLANSSPAGVIYENDDIRISVPNQNYISNATIKFRVGKEWLSGNNIEPESIALFRFKDQYWSRLPTDRVFENEMIIIYSANTPGFSPFAIAGEKLAPAPAPQPAIEPAVTPYFSPAPANTQISGAASMPSLIPENIDDYASAQSYISIAALVGGFAGVGTVTFLYYYTKPKGQG